MFDYKNYFNCHEHGMQLNNVPRAFVSHCCSVIREILLLNGHQDVLLLYLFNIWFKRDIMITEEFEDTKGVIRIRKSKDRKHNGQKHKQRSTKHTHQNKRSSYTIPTKNWKGKQFLLH